MAAKWQQWMPFRIDAFKGSPAVQAMHPCARIGYLYLLACCWQTDDCTIPNDPLELAERSGLGDELWCIHGPRILRKFSPGSDGRLLNQVLADEWRQAKAIFEKNYCTPEEISKKRSEAGRKGNAVRWRISQNDRICDDDGSQTNRKPSHTGTGTGTVTKTEEQKPSRAKAARATKSAESDQRHAEFKAAVQRYWDSKNPGIQMPWGPAEGKQLGMWLREAPHITLDQFTGFLRNRFKSQVNHGERPCQWIKWITSYGPGPTDRFKNTAEESNGASQQRATTGRVSPAKERVDANRRAIAETLAARGIHGPWDSAQPDGQAVPESGFNGRPAGVHDGPGAIGPEILPPES